MITAKEHRNALLGQSSCNVGHVQIGGMNPVIRLDHHPSCQPQVSNINPLVGDIEAATIELVQYLAWTEPGSRPVADGEIKRHFDEGNRRNLVMNLGLRRFYLRP